MIQVHTFTQLAQSANTCESVIDCVPLVFLGSLVIVGALICWLVFCTVVSQRQTAESLHQTRIAIERIVAKMK